MVSQQLDAWLAARPGLVHLLEQSDELAQRYARSGGHYARLAGRLRAQFGDERLVEAALAHGVPFAVLRHGGGLSPEVLTILEDWEQLRRVRPGDEGTQARLQSGLAQNVRDVRSILLLVYERLDRFDPGDILGAWSRAFHVTPAPLESVPEEVGPPGRFDDADPLAYADDIVRAVAEHWGLWAERNQLDDCVLLRRSRERFHALVDFAVRCSAPDGPCSRYVDFVRRCLEPYGWLREPDDVRWEWRHVASMDRALPQRKSEREPRGELHRCGFVTVRLQTEAECYEALGRLHRVAQHRRGSLMDFTGRHNPSGYRALHTVLVDDRQEGLSVPVRLLSRDAAERRSRLADSGWLRDLRQRFVENRARALRVYTPQGEPKDLPLGATVLNFALAIHGDMLLLAQSATLNGTERVGLLHVLKDGDEVRLELGSTPQPLPEGWELAVPRETAVRLRRAYRWALRPYLIEEGRTFVRKHLVACSHSDVDARLIDVLVEFAAAALAAEENRRKDWPARWWLEQLGLLTSACRPPAPDGRAIGPDDARRLIAHVDRQLESLATIEDQIEVDPAQRKGLRRLRVCTECGARDLVAGGAARARLVATMAEGELVLHREGEPCGRGGLRTAVRRRLSRNQFFVVETGNRSGTARDVLAAFNRHRIDIVEIVGRRLGPDWGVFRVEVDPTGPSAVRALQEDLVAVSGVRRVRIPGESRLTALESLLPPRRDARVTPFDEPPPYIAGGEINDDDYFYGRRDELAALSHLLDQAMAGTDGSGRMAFVTGPVKVGKTSLVLRFRRYLERLDGLDAVVLIRRAGSKREGDKTRPETWRDVERDLAAQLAAALDQPGRPRLPEGERGAPLGRLLRQVATWRKPPVIVIAVDEAVRLLEHTAADPEATRDLLGFRDLIQGTPGVLVVWTGPRAAARSLPALLRHVLVSSEEIEVGALGRDAAREHLEARKLAHIHRIGVGGELADHIYRYTAGNPFWIAHLGKAMWKLARRRGRGPVRYARALLREACHELFDYGTPFVDRLVPGASPLRERRGCWAALAHLARDGRRSGGLSAAEVLDAIRRTPELGDFGGEELDALFDRLLDLGAVRSQPGPPVRWSVAAPILADYVRHRLERSGQGSPA